MPVSKNKHPDVLIIMTDQLNPTCLGYEGDPAAKTPSIDALAQEGIWFDSHYTVSPVCMPARCSFISGLYPHNHTFWSNFTDRVFPSHLGTMFGDIRNEGYYTGHIGKSHYFNPGWGEDFRSYTDYFHELGIDHYEDITGPYMTPFHKCEYTEHLKEIGLLDAYMNDLAMRFENGQYIIAPSPLAPEDHNDGFIGRRSVEFVERCPTDRPFCLFTSFPGPHSPMDAPGEYADLIDPESVPIPPNMPAVTKLGSQEYGLEYMKRMRANYYGKIALIDDWCGRIFDALKKRGTWENTLVIFTADHGDMMGSQGRLAKGSFHEESARVPLVIRWPGHIPVSRRTSALAELIDIYPTIVEAIGGEKSSGRFGVSLLPVATGEVDAVHDAVFSEIGNALRYMVRTPEYKWWTVRGKESLYDMRDDRHELNDLAASDSHSGVCKDMRSRLGEFLMSTQYNESRDYKALFTRVGLTTGSEDIQGKMFALFKRLQA